MTQKMKWLPFMFILVFSMICISCAHARPPKPGQNFVWIKARKTPAGHMIPGHWKYNGPSIKGKVWVQGHPDEDGNWVAGHWKTLTPPKKGVNWVPGHYGPRGRWIPGHWR